MCSSKFVLKTSGCYCLRVENRNNYWRCSFRCSRWWLNNIIGCLNTVVWGFTECRGQTPAEIAKRYRRHSWLYPFHTSNPGRNALMAPLLPAGTSIVYHQQTVTRHIIISVSIRCFVIDQHFFFLFLCYHLSLSLCSMYLGP